MKRVRNQFASISLQNTQTKFNKMKIGGKALSPVNWAAKLKGERLQNLEHKLFGVANHKKMNL